MAEKDEGTAGKLPKELINVECPRCGNRISEDSEVKYQREDSLFVGFGLTCPKCGNEFNYTLY